MSLKYEFNKQVAADRLEDEVKNSAIKTALDYITTSGTTVSVIFKASLDTTDTAILAAIILNHIPIPLPSTPPPQDADNAQMVRIKTAPLGWFYQMLCTEFETSKKDSVVCKDHKGTNLPYCTAKFYNDAGDELAEDLSSCTKTVVMFEPNYDYEMIGGGAYAADAVTEDVRIWATAAPDIPYAHGGSRSLIMCMNLRYQSKFKIDGRNSKRMNYNAQYHTNKVQYTVTHPAGHNCKLMVVMEHYKA